MTEAKSIVAAEFLQNIDECIVAASDLASQVELRAKQVAELRSKFGQPLASLIAESASLQHKAKRKFGPQKNQTVSSQTVSIQTANSQPIIWWVTRRSLQQATAWQVAQLKASWLGNSVVHDLCCAIGGDAIALALRGPTIAVDRDPIMTAMAEANLSAAIPVQSSSPTTQQASWQTQCDDVVGFSLPRQSTLHIDPDRRTDGNNRGTQAQSFSPTWEEVLSLIEKSNSTIVKLAPATELDWQPSDQPSHRTWISLQGSVREQSLLVGDCVEKASLIDRGRSAYRMAADGSWHRFASIKDGDTPIATTSKTEAWLIDPVSSIRAAGLTESFATEHSLKTLGGPSGFLTSNEAELPDEIAAMATIGRVIWTGSANDRKLRSELRDKGWFPETVKCRSVDQDPADLFRRYRDCGDTPVILWIGRIGKKVYAAITQ